MARSYMGTALSVALLTTLAISVSAKTERAGYGSDVISRNGGIWSHQNLFAWCVVPFDANKRSPQERALMLKRLGFRSFAYDWRDENVPTFDAEIDSLSEQRIHLLAWWFPFDAEDAAAKATLDTFRRHNVHPQLWVPQSSRPTPETEKKVEGLLPQGVKIPKNGDDWSKLSDEQRKIIGEAFEKADATESPAERDQRVLREAERIKKLVALATPYGVRVELYNHNGWYGIEENQLAIIQKLKTLGVNDVGMVYNFSHARDTAHDDTKEFPALWKKIKPYVVAVNITGTHMDGDLIYPSQGDRELEMMRVIQSSGWKGPVGLIAEKGGDAEVTLRNYMKGLDWLAAEVQQSGSGGEPPFPRVP